MIFPNLAEAVKYCERTGKRLAYVVIDGGDLRVLEERPGIDPYTLIHFTDRGLRLSYYPPPRPQPAPPLLTEAR